MNASMKAFAPANAQLRLPDRLQEFLDSDPAADVRGTGPAHQSVLPFTGDALFSFPRAQASDVAAAARDARVSQPEWERMGIGGRARVLLKLHDLIQANEELILDLIQAENGKSRQHAYDEIMDVYNCCRFYATAARKAFGPQRHRGAIPVLTKTRTQYYPLGVVGLISPWNYPLSLGVGDVLAALSAGNAVVHKPDSQTTLVAIFVRRLAVAAGLPAGAWQLVPGRGAEVGDALIPLVDGVSFTGSTAVGRSVAAQAAERLLPTMAELGGKNPMLVLDDAPIAATAEGAVRTAFSSSGQLCISAERLYVASEIYDEFLDALKAQLDRQVLGAAFSDAATIGSLTSQAQLEKVQSHVDDAVAKGATVVYGGHARPELGPYFFEPTVLADVTPDMDCFAAETFGPALSVYRVDSDAEAVAAANDTTYGLSASVWSSNSRRAWKVASQLEAGMVNINEGYAAAFGSIAAPGGGVKDSGLNHRHGISGMRQWANKRTIAEQRLHPIAPSGYISAEQFRPLVTNSLRLLKEMRL